MSSIIGALLIIGVGASRIALRDVPVGECHGCEVTCFEDCSLKYEREILADDFLQLPPKPDNKSAKNHTSLGLEMIDCLKEENCPCPKEQAKGAKNGTAFVQAFVQNATCAVQPKGAASCAQGCSDKVLEKLTPSLRRRETARM